MSAATSDEMGLGTGAAVGAGAWVLGAILTFILAQLGVNTGLALLVGFSPIAGPVYGYTALHSWFAMSGSGLGSLALFTIVPIILLLGAGYYVASQNEGTGPMAGVSVAAGYLALAILSAVIMLALLPGGGIPMMELVIALVISGVVFPLVFAGIGGAIADQV